MAQAQYWVHVGENHQHSTRHFLSTYSESDSVLTLCMAFAWLQCHGNTRVRSPASLHSLLLYCPSPRVSLPHPAEKASAPIQLHSPSLGPWTPWEPQSYHFLLPGPSPQNCASLNIIQIPQTLHSASLHVSSIIIKTCCSLTSPLTVWSLPLLGAPWGPCSHSLPLSESCFSPNPSYRRVLLAPHCLFLSLLMPSSLTLLIFFGPCHYELLFLTGIV